MVAVYDTGADETSRFIVMELVSGRSLDAILREEGALDPDRAAGIAARVLMRWRRRMPRGSCIATSSRAT